MAAKAKERRRTSRGTVESASYVGHVGDDCGREKTSARRN